MFGTGLTSNSMDGRQADGKAPSNGPTVNLDTVSVNQNEELTQRERPEPEVTPSELFEEDRPFIERGSRDEDDKASVAESTPKASDQRKSRPRRKSRSETDPLLMAIPELTRFLQAQAAKRKTRVAQRQRAALLGFLPPGMLPPPKVLGKQGPATESTIEPKDSGLKPPPGVSKSVVQKAVPKLRRKSLLEHMERQMERHGQKAVLFRMVTIGSHEGNPDALLEYHEKLMKELNAAPELEFLTGLLIVYPNHFLHVLEGSEMALSDYIRDVAYEFEKKQTLLNLEGDNVQNVYMIILGTFQVNQRFMKKWQGVATPYPTHSNLMDIIGYQKRLFEFMKRTWVLLMVSQNFISTLPSIKDAEEAKASIPRPTVDKPFKGVNLVPKPTESDFDLLSITTFAPVVDNINDSVNELMEESISLLPSLRILQYFLKNKERCPKLLTPQQHIEKYWGLSNEPSWRDIVWPIPGQLYPYD